MYEEIIKGNNLILRSENETGINMPERKKSIKTLRRLVQVTSVRKTGV